MDLRLPELRRTAHRKEDFLYYLFIHKGLSASLSVPIYSSSSPWLRANGRANSSASTHVKECIDFAFVDQWIGAELFVPD